MGDKSHRSPILEIKFDSGTKTDKRLINKASNVQKGKSAAKVNRRLKGFSEIPKNSVMVEVMVPSKA